MDIISTTTKIIDHNRWLVAAIILLIILLSATVGIMGCSATTLGLAQGDNQPVTVNRQTFIRQATNRKTQLDAEQTQLAAKISAFNEQVRAGLDDLDHQDELRAQILNTISIVATDAASGSLNPAALIPLAIGLGGGILGIGAGLDNRRKDRVIADIKQTQTPQRVPPVAA